MANYSIVVLIVLKIVEVSGRVDGFRWDRIAVLRGSVGSFSPLFVVLLLLLLVHKMCHVAIWSSPTIQHLLAALRSRCTLKAKQLLWHVFHITRVHIHVHVDVYVHVYVDVRVVGLGFVADYPALLFLFEFVIQIMEGLLVVALRGKVRITVACILYGDFRAQPVH